jgi:hypothetical protein
LTHLKLPKQSNLIDNNDNICYSESNNPETSIMLSLSFEEAALIFQLQPLKAAGTVGTEAAEIEKEEEAKDDRD